MNAFTHFSQTLDRIREILSTPESACALEPPPCRTTLYPAGEVPLDTCGSDTCSGADGQLWVNLQPATIVDSGPGCTRFLLTGQVGVARCAATSRTGVPSAEAVAGNAWQQALDADKIADAIVCCADLEPDRRARVAITGWAPIDNQGGCYGGYYTLQATYDVCC